MSTRTANQERKGRESAKKSYKEDSDSVEEEVEEVEAGATEWADPKDKDFAEEDATPSEESEEEEDGSEWGEESSGSEYGKKKKKMTPKKGGRGRGRPSGGGRGRVTRGKKRGRKGDSDEESESEGDSSGSEYGKKKKKPKVTTPKKKKATPTPTRRAAPRRKAVKKDDDDEEDEEPPSPPGRARRGRATSKSYKEASDEEIDEVQVEPQETTSSSKRKPPASKKARMEKKEENDQNGQDKSPEDEPEGNGNGTGNGNGLVEDDDEAADHGDDHAATPLQEHEEKEGLDKKNEGGGGGGLQNRTDTDYSVMEFGSTKKTRKGDSWNFKIACWNIGGIKAWLKKNGLEYISREDPDILCLNEVKCNEKTKPEEVKNMEKYPHQYWSYNQENAGHYGVAIFSKQEPKHIRYGFPEHDEDSASDKKKKEGFSSEGRMITAEFEDFYLVNVYVPNGGRAEKSEKYPKGYPPKVANGERIKFDDYFRDYIKHLEKKKPVIVAGDMNVAHEEIDLANPSTNSKTAGFTQEEREDFTKLLEETTLFDSFRELYPDKKGNYTFWSYMHNSRAKNVGWRLDYFLMSAKLKDSLVDSVMRKDIYGSDHCPIVLFMYNE